MKKKSVLFYVLDLLDIILFLFKSISLVRHFLKLFSFTVFQHEQKSVFCMIFTYILSRVEPASRPMSGGIVAPPTWPSEDEQYR